MSNVYKGPSLLLGALSLSFVPVALSQAVSDTNVQQGVALEEVIVTAQKRENSAQLTAVSLTAASGDALREANIRAPQDLSGVSPSLSATMSNGQLQVSIRGVGNEIITTGVGESGIAIHNNGVYMGSNLTPSLGFFDVDRVEILRGPQGTLWGRNATGGAINIIQQRPDSDFNGYVDVSYGSFQTRNIEAAVGGSLTDSMQARLTVLHSGGNGYLKNLSENGEDLGGAGTDAARLSINIELDEDSYWLLAAGYGNRDIYGQAIRQEGTPFPVGSVNPISGTAGELTFAEAAFGPTTTRGRFETYSSSPFVHDELELSYFTSELDKAFDAFNLSLLSDFRKHDSSALRDVDYTATSVRDTTAFYVEKGEEFSQEVRLSSNGSSDHEWVVGAYYYKQDLQSDIKVQAGPYPGVPDILYGGVFGPDYVAGAVNSGGILEVESKALFGQGTWQATDDFGVTLGLRFGEDRKEASEYSEVRLGSTTGPILQGLTGKVTGEWSDWSGKLGIEYRASNDVFLFANVAKGYKSGGINLGSLTGAFEPEELINYEAGFKATLLDSRLRINSTLFFSDFSDYQFQSVKGVNTVITNGDAEVYGLEAELDYLPNESWLLKFVASYNHSEITNFSEQGLRNPATGGLVQAGGPLPRTPEYSYKASAKYFVDLESNAELSFKLSYYWQDKVNLDSFGTFNGDQEDYGVLDFSVQWLDEAEIWSVDLYGKNLSNEYYKTSTFFNAALLGGAAQAQIAMPRNYGIRVRRNF